MWTSPRMDVRNKSYFIVDELSCYFFFLLRPIIRKVKRHFRRARNLFLSDNLSVCRWQFSVGWPSLARSVERHRLILSSELFGKTLMNILGWCSLMAAERDEGCTCQCMCTGETQSKTHFTTRNTNWKQTPQPVHVWPTTPAGGALLAVWQMYFPSAPEFTKRGAAAAFISFYFWFIFHISMEI